MHPKKRHYSPFYQYQCSKNDSVLICISYELHRCAIAGQCVCVCVAFRFHSLQTDWACQPFIISTYARLLSGDEGSNGCKLLYKQSASRLHLNWSTPPPAIEWKRMEINKKHLPLSDMTAFGLRFNPKYSRSRCLITGQFKFQSANGR